MDANEITGANSSSRPPIIPSSRQPMLSSRHPVIPSSRHPVGLLAGSGRFPIVFAEKARSLGLPVVCVGIRHEADPRLAECVSRFYWSLPARLGRIIRLFKGAGVERVVMAGKVHKANILHKPWK